MRSDIPARRTGDPATAKYGKLSDYAMALKVLAFTMGDPTKQYYDVEWPDVLAPLVSVYAEDSEWLVSLAKTIRRVGRVKNGILIASHLFTSAEIADVLNDMPVTQLLKFAEMARKKSEVFGGLSHRKKKGIAKILKGWSVERNEFQAIKYRDTMRDLLKLVHPVPPTDAHKEIWGWVVGKSSAPTERIKAYEKIASGTLDAETAAQLALEHKLPWEVLRSHVKVDEIPEQLFEEVVERLMTPTDRALQASTIAKKMDTDFVLSSLNSLYRNTSVFYLAKMALGLFKQKLISPDEGEQIVDFISQKIPSELRERELILDMSGSMDDYWYRSRIQEIGLALKPRGEVVAFSNKAWRVSVDFTWWAEGWKRYFGGWTCITCGLREADRGRATLITDEQHNAGSIYGMLEETQIKDLVYATVGVYRNTLFPKVHEKVRRIVFTAGDTLPATVAGIQAGELLSKVKLYEEVPSPEEIEEELERIKI